MPHSLFAETTASIAEFKRDPMGTVAAGNGLPVAIFNHNQPVFYCIPAKTYEEMLNQLEDVELNLIAEGRQGQAEVKVSLRDL